jgi:hypothetical protein
MSDELIMSLKATNGILNIYEDRVVISRKTGAGVLMQGLKGDLPLFYKDLASVEFRKPTIWANGYIKFILRGVASGNAAVRLTGWSTAESAKDPNTLILRAFNKKTPVESEKAYDIVMKKISEAKSQSNVVAQTVQATSDADELTKFKKLLDDGIITQEEFDKKKAQILGL